MPRPPSNLDLVMLFQLSKWSFFPPIFVSAGKVSLDLVDSMTHFVGNSNVLHDMGANTTKKRFGQDSPVCHVKEINFPTDKFVVHISNYQLEVTIGGPRMEYGKPKVFPKGGVGIHSKHNGQLISSITKEIGGKEGLGLVVVVSLARLRT